MGYLKYKGYTGSVEYSEEDKCLFGKVQGMAKDSITYEGSTVEELTEDFEGAIDDYLALCEEKGIEPHKPNAVARALGVLKLVVFVLAFMMSIGTFAQKEKIIKDSWHAKVWLKDGTTDSGYITNGHYTVCVYDERVVLNNLDGLFSKNRSHATKDIDSMYIWFDTEPDEVLISHAVPVHYYYGNETPMEYGYPSMCYVLYQSKNVTIYDAWDLFLGDVYLYKTPDMQYAKALFRKGKKLTEKRRATLCDEFENYSIIKNYIKSIHKDKLKDDPYSFFLVIDKALGSGKKD